MPDVPIVNRSKIIKDPVWVPVKNALASYLDQLIITGTENEILVAQKRYLGLKYHDVVIEPAVEFDGGQVQVCIVSRKTGFVRADIIIKPVELTDIFKEFEVPYTTIKTKEELTKFVDEGMSTGSALVWLEFSNRFCFVVSLGDSIAEKVNALTAGIFFSKITLNETTDPTSPVRGTLTIEDHALKETKCDLIVKGYIPPNRKLVVTKRSLAGNKFTLEFGMVDDTTEVPLKGLNWELQDATTKYRLEPKTFESNVNVDGSAGIVSWELEKHTDVPATFRAVGSVKVDGRSYDYDESMEVSGIRVIPHDAAQMDKKNFELILDIRGTYGKAYTLPETIYSDNSHNVMSSKVSDVRTTATTAMFLAEYEYIPHSKQEVSFKGTVTIPEEFDREIAFETEGMSYIIKSPDVVVDAIPDNNLTYSAIDNTFEGSADVKFSDGTNPIGIVLELVLTVEGSDEEIKVTPSYTHDGSVLKYKFTALAKKDHKVKGLITLPEYKDNNYYIFNDVATYPVVDETPAE